MFVFCRYEIVRSFQKKKKHTHTEREGERGFFSSGLGQPQPRFSRLVTISSYYDKREGEPGESRERAGRERERGIGREQGERERGIGRESDALRLKIEVSKGREIDAE